MSDHGGPFLDYLIENHKCYMGLPMALSRNRYINKLSVINRYIDISDGKLGKQQQCKKATRLKSMQKIFFSGSHLWRLDGNMLQNKADHLWMSDEEWNFNQTKDDLFYIENISKTKVLEATIDGEVILEDFQEYKAEQLWKKGESSGKGYFTLENSKLLKIMTAYNNILQVKGNVTLRWIVVD